MQNPIQENKETPLKNDEAKELPKTEQAPNTGHITIFDKLLRMLKL